MILVLDDPAAIAPAADPTPNLRVAFTEFGARLYCTRCHDGEPIPDECAASYVAGRIHVWGDAHPAAGPCPAKAASGA